MAKGALWAKGRRRLEAAKGQGHHRRQGPPRDKGRYWPRLTKGVGHEEKVAMGQREGMAIGAKGLKASESTKGYQECLRAKGPGKFLWLKVPSRPGT